MPFLPASLSCVGTHKHNHDRWVTDRAALRPPFADRYTTVTTRTRGRDGRTPGHAGAGDARGATHPGPATWR